MNEALLNYISRRHLDRDYIQKKCREIPGGFAIKLRNFDGPHGRQNRILQPKPDELKSKTEYGSTGRYFLDSRDEEKDEILIVEGEIDFLSIIPFANGYNLIGLKGINNLSHCIKDIETLKKVYDIYILVDNDSAADEAIKRIPYTPLHLYDVRDALNDCKDVNEAICQGKLNLSVFPKRIVKLKPQPKKKRDKFDTYATVDRINSIPAIDILETLFPEYSRRGISSICENGKETHGYKYSKELNIVRDFSEKGRPAGNTFQIAKHKFGDSKLVFQYFKGKL